MVDEDVRANVYSDALVRWRASNKRVKELKGLMHSFRDVKLEGEFDEQGPRVEGEGQRVTMLTVTDSLRAILRTWGHSAVQSQERKRILAQAERERDQNILRASLAHWRSRYRERDLEPIVSTECLSLTIIKLSNFRY